MVSNESKTNNREFRIKFAEPHGPIAPDAESNDAKNIESTIDAAYKEGIKSHADLTVLPYDDVFFILTPEKSITTVPKAEFSQRLDEISEVRKNVSYYKTILQNDNGFYSQFQDKVAEFRTAVQRLFQLNMFEGYYDGSNMHFGFLAMRIENDKFLITSRGSSKAGMPLDDIVLIDSVDWENKIVHVKSSGKKASLNANVAARLFKELPEMKYILHSHNALGLKNETSTDYPLGTQEDIDEVVPRLIEEPAVDLKNHGCMALGKDLGEVIGNAGHSHVYNNFPEFYDIVYHRFQKSDDFFRLIEKELKKDDKILDLCCGTGEASINLWHRGYRNIAGIDMSKKMLDFMAVKLKREGVQMPLKEHSMDNIPNLNCDGIVIRQAINYLMPYERLAYGFKQMHQSLSSEGKLIFNSPNLDALDCSSKVSCYSAGDYDVKVHEMNHIEGKIITHTQRCMLIDRNTFNVKKIYDLNRFALYSQEEFRDALLEAGFSKIRFYRKGLYGMDEKSRSLYCVAEK